MGTLPKQWAQLQARWRKADGRLRTERATLTSKYGQTWLAPRGKRDKLDAICAREAAATEAIFAWLDQHSPRQWRTGCAYAWVCEHLTFEDAVTSGQLSAIPDYSWGHCLADVIRFSAQVKGGAA